MELLNIIGLRQVSQDMRRVLIDTDSWFFSLIGWLLLLVVGLAMIFADLEDRHKQAGAGENEDKLYRVLIEPKFNLPITMLKEGCTRADQSDRGQVTYRTTSQNDVKATPTA
jgi:hypothetical protein